MSLTEIQEDLKKQLAEAQEREAAETEEEVEESPEEIEPEKEPEVKEEAEEKEEEKPAEKVEEKTDNAAMARMRREKAAAERVAEEARAERDRYAKELAEARARPEVEVESPVVPPELQELLNERNVQKAWEELESFEGSVRKENPDYDAVAGVYASALAQSIRLQNPRITPSQLAERTRLTILEKAAGYHSQGLNPAEELYHEAKELGFEAPKAAEAKEEVKAPDMAKVAANRARNAGTVAAPGAGSSAQLTKKAATEMTIGEYAKLPKAERERLMRQA